MPEEQQSQSTTSQQVTQKIVRPQPFPNIYCNGVSASLGFFEIRLVFFEVTPTGPNEVTTNERVSITLSPECFKLLASSIEKSVSQYEEQFGKIRDIPADAKTP